MIIHYEPAPLPGRTYCARVRWVPELEDWVMITLLDPERIQQYFTDEIRAEIPARMCEAVQNIPTVAPGRRLRAVAS